MTDQRLVDLPKGAPVTEYVFDTTHDRYPVAVHVILTDTGSIVGSADGDGRVLLMRRAGSGYADGLLGLLAGDVDLGETPTHCAIREVGEELGISLDPGELDPAGVMFRWVSPADLPDDTLDFVGQAIADAHQGHHFHEYGWARTAV